ncbi:MAG: phosphatase PAP2 family protein [Firmicutes bacterium]|nr:phosphatase PAP2 family protein [Bacillota bacterium]
MDIDILLFLQGLREAMPGWLVFALAEFSDIVVNPAVYVVLAGVYWCRDKRLGSLLSLNIIAGVGINQLLKNTFCVYRPWVRDPRVVPAAEAVGEATGYSFPSGHTVQGTAQFGTLAGWFGGEDRPFKSRRGLRVFFGALPFLIGFSRNLLGVHTPQDVLAGLAIGLLTIWLGRRLLAWLDAEERNDLLFAGACCALSAAMLAYISLKSYPADLAADGSLLVDPRLMMNDCYSAAGTLAGFSLGFAWERHRVRFAQKAPTPALARFRFLGGGSGMMLLFLGARPALYAALGPHFGRFAAYGLLFIFAIAIWPAVFTAYERKAASLY